MAAGIDPAGDPQGALRYIRSTLAAFDARQGELAVWFEALGKQIVWGVVRCVDVIEYNLWATKLYDAQVDFFTWIAPTMRAIEAQTGTVVLTVKTVPLPQLIGTRYWVYDRGGGKKQFDVGVECDAVTGDFSTATPRSGLQIAPQPVPASCATDGAMNGTLAAVAPIGRTYWSPNPTITDLRFAGFGGSSQTDWIKLAIVAMVVIGVSVALGIIRDSLSTITGVAVQELNNEAYGQYIRGRAERASQINVCFLAKLMAVGGVVDPQTSKQLWADCEAGNPPVAEPRYGSTWTSGLIGLAIALGVVGLGVVAIRSSSGRRRDSSDEE